MKLSDLKKCRPKISLRSMPLLSNSLIARKSSTLTTNRFFVIGGILNITLRCFLFIRLFQSAKLVKRIHIA